MRIDRLAGTHVDQRYRTVNTDLPAFAVAEFLQRFLGHECDDNRLGLGA